MNSGDIFTNAQLKNAKHTVTVDQIYVITIVTDLRQLFAEREAVLNKMDRATEISTEALAEKDFTHVNYETHVKRGLVTKQEEIETMIAMLQQDGARPVDQYVLTLIVTRVGNRVIDAYLQRVAATPSFSEVALRD